MQSMQVEYAGPSRLRFVFNDTVVSLGVPAQITFGEIAQRFAALSDRHQDSPVAVDLTLSPSRRTAPPSIVASPRS
jgi:hypothetical protein